MIEVIERRPVDWKCLGSGFTDEMIQNKVARIMDGGCLISVCLSGPQFLGLDLFIAKRIGHAYPTRGYAFA